PRRTPTTSPLVPSTTLLRSTAGSNTTYTANVGALGGFSSPVSVTVSGLPAGATATATPSSVTGSGSTSVSVTTSTTTVAGTYPLTLTGTPANGSSPPAPFAL